MQSAAISVQEEREGQSESGCMAAAGHEDGLQDMRLFLETEFRDVRQELSEILEELRHARSDPGRFGPLPTPSGMNKHSFNPAVSEKVKKLANMVEHVPVVRRRRLSLPSWGGDVEMVNAPSLAYAEDGVGVPRQETVLSIERMESLDIVEEVDLTLSDTMPGMVPELYPERPEGPDLPPEAPRPAGPAGPAAPAAEHALSNSKELAKAEPKEPKEQPIPRTASKKDLSSKWVQLQSEDAKQNKLNLFERKNETVDKVGRGMGLVAGADDFHVKVFRSNFHRKRYAIATSSYFEILTIILICSSALQIGLSTNVMAENLVTETTSLHRTLEVIYCVIFTLELFVRMVAHRLEFFTQVGWAWNVFDLLLVGIQLLEELLVAASGPMQSGLLKQVSPTTLLRIARILRAVRVLRVLRIAFMAEDLRLLVSCLLYCTRPFFWTFVLLGLLIYIVGIYITQLVLFHRVEDDEGHSLAQYFGSVPLSMLSLFEGMTGGVDWDVLVSPIFELNSTVGAMIVFYQAFAIIGVMNVVTGTFVQNAITRAEEVKDLQHAMKARKLFKSLDDDHSGQISYREILSHAKDHEVQDFFKDLDIEPSEARFLFEMLDTSHSGSIDFEEFLNGCIRLQGPAKAIDMLVVTRETRLVYENLGQNMQMLRAELNVLSERLLGLSSHSNLPDAPKDMPRAPTQQVDDV